MEPNKFEKQFKEQLNSREIKPSGMAWDKLDAMLTADDEKPKRNFKWFYLAASVLGFILVSTVYFNSSENVKINEIAPVVLEQKGNVNNSEGSKVSNEEFIPGQIQKKTIKIQTVVTYNNNPKKQPKEFKDKEKEVLVINQSKDNSLVVNSSENNNNETISTNKYISAKQLLAEVSDTKFENETTEERIQKTKKAITVNPNDLLLNAETELDQSFKESALDRFNKNYKAIKTVLVNRNYKE